MNQHANGQITSSNEYYIQNKLSSKLIDVRGGSTAPGSQIWQYNINYSRSQVFRIIQLGPAENLVYTIHAQVSNHLLSIKRIIPTSVSSETSTTSDVVGEFPTAAEGDHSPTATDNTSGFAIVQDNRYQPDLLHDISIFGNKPQNQQWKFIPVGGEANTYYIQSTAFTTSIALQPINGSEAQLQIAPFVGSDLQKWKVLSTRPKEVTQLQLSDFTWERAGFLFLSGKIKGKLKWTDNSDNEEGFEIFVKRKEANGDYSSYWSLGTVAANKINYSFSDGSKHGKGRDHCFRVTSNNKWGNKFSSDVCKIPNFDQPPPPPPDTGGIKNVIVFNCHSDKKPVRIWTLDYTTGLWEDRGVLNSQWSGSSCPSGSPKEFTLTNGHAYQIKAIDCGSNPPVSTEGSCHKLTTIQPIKGKTNGNTLTLNIQ